MRPLPPERRIAAAAAAGLGLVLVVLVASAAIRLNAAGIAAEPFLSGFGLAVVRGVHRTAASLEVLVALYVAFLAWQARTRRVPAGVVVALTVVLSVIGIVGGQEPPAAIAASNLLGGLALASVFALLSGTEPDLNRAPSPILVVMLSVLLALQVVIGARLTLVDRYEMSALPVHAMLGLGLAVALAWFARPQGAAGASVVVLAVAAPIAGFSALQYEYSAGAALVHAIAAALFLAAAAFALARKA